jgi:hypothetical protein
VDLLVDVQKVFLRKFRESFAKTVAIKMSMEASSPLGTFAAASQANVVNNETLLFPGGILLNFPNMALHI